MIELFRTLFAPPRDLVLVVAALWIGLALAEKRTERYGVSKETLNNLVFYSLLGFLLGGRIMFAAANFSAFADSPLNLFSINIDLFDPLGGVLMALIVGSVFLRRLQLPFWSALDGVTPVIASLAIGLHLSHLAAGTAFGRTTDLPWAMEMWNARRHPAQLYELVGALIIFVWIWFRRANVPPGVLFLNFTALTAAARLFFEAFRQDSTLILGGVRLAQIVGWVVLALSIYAIEKRKQPLASGPQTETASFV